MNRSTLINNVNDTAVVEDTLKSEEKAEKDTSKEREEVFIKQ